MNRPVRAGAAIPISLEDIVGLSRHVVVGIPRDATSNWEGTGNGRRIVTYSRVEIQQPVDGREPPGSEAYVRTLGGRIGDIGQIVHGEATLVKDEPAVLFLHEAISGAFGVTAMAQGHYVLTPDDDGRHRLLPSPNLSEFITKDTNSAVARLRGKTIPDCERLVERALQGN